MIIESCIQNRGSSGPQTVFIIRERTRLAKHPAVTGQQQDELRLNDAIELEADLRGRVKLSPTRQSQDAFVMLSAA